MIINTPGQIIETEFLYKILPDLPQIPEELLNQNLKSDRVKHIPQIPNFEGFKRDDGKTVSPKINGWLTPLNVEQWVNENIGPTNRGLFYREVEVDDEKNFYPPHIDVNRKFILLYNIVDSGGDFCFWQEGDLQITRSMLTRAMCFDYSKMKLLATFRVPPKTWYMINTQVLHSVENLTGVRKNIQFNCEPWDPLVVEHLKPLHKVVPDVRKVY